MGTETKHTPGPWKYSRTHGMSSDTWYVITDAKGYGPVIDVGGKDRNGQIAEAKYLITDPARIEANARLIAHAPQMVELLRDWLNEFGPWKGCKLYVRTETLLKELEAQP